MTNADLASMLLAGALEGNQLYLEKLRVAFHAGKKAWKIDALTSGGPVSFETIWELREDAETKKIILKLATQGLIPMIDHLMPAINVHGLKVRIRRSPSTGIYLFRGEFPRSQTAWRKGTTDLEETKQMARDIDPMLQDFNLEFILEDDAAA